MFRAVILLLSLTLVACSNGNGDNTNANDSNNTVQESPAPDFTTADAWLESFVDVEPLFPGGSMVIVDKKRGIIHQSAFGNQTEESLVLLASTSKVPTVMLLMALHEDDVNVNFDIQAAIANYLPWQGVWDPAITTEHLVSNRSGIPGLGNVFSRPADYGVHLCQYLPVGTLQECAEKLYTTPLPALASTPANTAFDYGGSAWQLAGAVAELVGGGTWNQLWDQYIGEPCGLEIARFGNMLSAVSSWEGNPEGLLGQDNPNMEAGLMSNLEDYAALISLHLNDGACGDTQVLSPEGVAFMREERTPSEGGSLGYGMGWWIVPASEEDSVYLYVDPGFYGAVSWIDIKREYGGVALFEEYSGTDGGIGSQGVLEQLIPIIEEAIDAVR
jgi:CubicO group peptidase (beta-lactamase class C family)|tara:strand:- start:14118 stop:15278 length:1161 start_codon:yes stop_codon:yes gene_type:complete